MKIQAKKFKTRKDIDRYISREFGNDIPANRARSEQDKNPIVIEGTDEELGRLNLSENTTVWGFKVKSKTRKKKVSPDYENTKAIR